MANSKKQQLGADNQGLDTPFQEELLANIPLGFRFMISKETNSIGELYKRVKFSKSKTHQSNQYTTYPCHKPISNIMINDDYDSQLNEE